MFSNLLNIFSHWKNYSGKLSHYVLFSKELRDISGARFTKRLKDYKFHHLNFRCCNALWNSEIALLSGEACGISLSGMWDVTHLNQLLGPFIARSGLETALQIGSFRRCRMGIYPLDKHGMADTCVLGNITNKGLKIFPNYSEVYIHTVIW